MLIVIFINKPVIPCVIRRININTFHLLTVTRLQKIQGLEIIRMDENAVGGGVERLRVGEGGE